MAVELKVYEEEPIELLVEDAGDEAELDANTAYMINTDDYANLKNLPTFNGEPLIGDVVEADPTVPQWAKADSPKDGIKPADINAVSTEDAISLAYLASLFN